MFQSTLELANKLQETVAPDMLAQTAKKKLLFKKVRYVHTHTDPLVDTAHTAIR